jgi:hypothetical protein
VGILLKYNCKTNTHNWLVETLSFFLSFFLFLSFLYLSFLLTFFLSLFLPFTIASFLFLSYNARRGRPSAKDGDDPTPGTASTLRQRRRRPYARKGVLSHSLKKSCSNFLKSHLLTFFFTFCSFPC